MGDKYMKESTIVKRVFNLIAILLIIIPLYTSMRREKLYNFDQLSYSGITQDNFDNYNYLEDIFKKRNTLNLIMDLLEEGYNEDDLSLQLTELEVNNYINQMIHKETMDNITERNKSEDLSKSEAKEKYEEFTFDSMFILLTSIIQELKEVEDISSIQKEHLDSFRDVIEVNAFLMISYRNLRENINVGDLTADEKRLEQLKIIATKEKIEETERVEIKSFNNMMKKIGS